MSIATEITALNTNLTAAKNAVTAKGGTVGDTGLAGLATEISTIPSGGSADVVNGIIANFKATSSTIDANTFVEFVNTITVGGNKQLSTTTYSYDPASATQIDTDKVFVAHRSGNYLYGVVCTISGTTITAGTDTQLSTTSNSYKNLALCAIDTDKVFIVHRDNNSNLNGVVCTISDTTITVGADTQLVTYGGSDYPSITALGTDKVFVVYPSTAKPYGFVCTISGTNITKGSDAQLSTAASSGSYTSVTQINADKVFVAHKSGNYLYGVVCTVSGTTITVGTDTQLSTVTMAYAKPSATTVSTNKTFVAFRSASSGFHGVVCTISGTTITAGTDTQLPTASSSASFYNGSVTSAITLNSDKVFVVYGGNNELCGVTCAIMDTSIICTGSTQLLSHTYAGTVISAVKVDANKIFAINNNSYYLYGVAFTASDITAQASTSSIHGLTKTECTTTTAGEVWVLNP